MTATSCDNLTDYHKGVIQWLQKNIAWANKFGLYPEFETELDTPAVYFSVIDFDKATSQPQSGKLALDLNCEVLILMPLKNENYQLDIRDAAAAIALAVEGNRFDMNIQPASFSTSSPSSFSPDLDAYSIWAVNFFQRIEIGTSIFDFVKVNIDRVFTGIDPKIGKAHEQDYTEITKNG